MRTQRLYSVTVRRHLRTPQNEFPPKEGRRFCPHSGSSSQRELATGTLPAHVWFWIANQFFPVPAAGLTHLSPQTIVEDINVPALVAVASLLTEKHPVSKLLVVGRGDFLAEDPEGFSVKMGVSPGLRPGDSWSRNMSDSAHR